MKEIVIIKTGDSIPSLVAGRGDFEDWIIAGIGNSHPFPTPVVAVHRGEQPPDFARIGGIVITGSHAMVTDKAEWSEKTAAWLVSAIEHEIPILGICFGHQLLAHALGGKVGPTPGGPEFGTVPVTLTPNAQMDPLFRDLPQPVEVQTSHYQAVTELPPKSTLLAFSEKDSHSAFRYGQRAWGVQFHPEYDAEIANAYIREFNKDIEQSPKDAELMPYNSQNTLTGKQLFSRFVAFVTEAAKQAF